eukprot:g19908.t1
MATTFSERCISIMASTATQAAQEAARLGISATIQGVATGIIEIGASTPVVAPLCIALLKAKGIARVQPGPKPAPVPKKAPVTKSLLVVRDVVVDRVCKILGGDGGPAVAALTGRSGAGKATSAAAMVGERGERVRALFADGVVWLSVGNGAGAADRSPRLMLKLAKRLHQGVGPPVAGGDGGSYVKIIVSQEELKCLVVAYDVWEGEVVQALREAGMWVLLTTRPESMVDVEPNERVVVDTLTKAEAEDVLRGAAELPPGECLCDVANDVLKICGRAAMDTAFVGSWICHVETKQKEDAWARAVEKIKDQGGGVGVETEVNRLVILRAGLEYLGTENASDKFLMHDAHMELAREGLVGGDKVREPAVERWTRHISRLDIVADMDVYALMRMWRALEVVGGDRWWSNRPYDDHLIQMDVSNRLTISALGIVISLYSFARRKSELARIMEKAEPLFRRMLEINEAKLGADHVDVAWTLHELGVCVRGAGLPGEAEPLFRRILEIGEAKLGADDVDVAWTLHELGVCVRDAGRPGEAEPLFRRSLEIKEAKLGGDDQQVAVKLDELGVCVREAGRPGEAEPLLRQSLEIKEAKLGADDQQVAVKLHDLGVCVREAGRPGEAEPLFRRSLEIKEAMLGAEDQQVAVTLHDLGVCVREAGRPGEAEPLFRRSLEIKDAMLGADDLQVA